MSEPTSRRPSTPEFAALAEAIEGLITRYPQGVARPRANACNQPAGGFKTAGGRLFGAIAEPADGDLSTSAGEPADGGLSTSAGESSAAFPASLPAPTYAERYPHEPEPSHDDLGSLLCQTRAMINRLELVFARLADRFATTVALDMYEEPASWIRQECRMTSNGAMAALQVGAHEADLPASLEAFQAGRIGFTHLGLLAQTAEFAATRPVPQPFDEGVLLPAAERETVARFRTRCWHLEHAMDAASCVKSENDAYEWRRLRLRPSDGGSMSITGRLDAEGGMLLLTALEPLARPDGAKDPRGRDQRLADALVELANHRLDTGTIPARASQRSHIQVTASLETLQGLRGAAGGEMENGAGLSDAAVQRLACDATITRVILDAESQVMDLGRSKRVVNPATRRVLNIRDKGCRWPGCDRTASWTQAHHILHWAAHHGETKAENLVLLCYRHHRMVHEYGFQIVRTADDEVFTFPPPVGFDMRPPPPAARAA